MPNGFRWDMAVWNGQGFAFPLIKCYCDESIDEDKPHPGKYREEQISEIMLCGE
jgi:hypothetical protein